MSHGVTVQGLACCVLPCGVFFNVGKSSMKIQLYQSITDPYVTAVMLYVKVYVKSVYYSYLISALSFFFFNMPQRGVCILDHFCLSLFRPLILCAGFVVTTTTLCVLAKVAAGAHMWSFQTQVQ